jgi:hypothetical protein
MTSFLFWNVMNNDVAALIARAALDRDVDVLMLAESATPDADLVVALKAATRRDYAALSEPSDKVRLFTRLAVSRWRRRQTEALRARMAVWSVRVGKPPGVILAAAHFVSKNNASPTEQALYHRRRRAGVSYGIMDLAHLGLAWALGFSANGYGYGRRALSVGHGPMLRPPGIRRGSLACR